MNKKLLYKMDHKYHFYSVFQPDSGQYLRSGMILDGKDSNIDPFMATFPELIDVGVMGHCRHGKLGLCIQSGVECYQDGKNMSQENMSFSNFERIVKECKGRTFQFALGGKGDVDEHNHFADLLKCCYEAGIVPNFTTSGYRFCDEKAKLCKKYCGAVAVSWYRSPYTLKTIECLIKHHVKTNIHFVVSRDSIGEAVKRLENHDFPKGINAVIFLLHKPIGLGTSKNVLKMDALTNQFFNLIDNGNFPFKIGFDSCFIPAILNACKNIDEMSIDTCEGGRWSAYITPDMKMLPCSFDTVNKKWAYDISHASIQEAWNSELFEDFRSHFVNTCYDCEKRNMCMGGCPITPEIVMCSQYLA